MSSARARTRSAKRFRRRRPGASHGSRASRSARPAHRCCATSASSSSSCRSISISRSASNQSTAIRTDLTDPTLLVAGELAGGRRARRQRRRSDQRTARDRPRRQGTPAEVAVHLFAELMAMRMQLGPDSRSFMLATPDLGIPDPDVLAVIEGFVDEHPDVDFQTLSFVPGVHRPVPDQRRSGARDVSRDRRRRPDEPCARDRPRAAAHGARGHDAAGRRPAAARNGAPSSRR